MSKEQQAQEQPLLYRRCDRCIDYDSDRRKIR